MTEAELDRLLGTAYLVTEQCFRPAMRLGFGAKFAPLTDRWRDHHQSFQITC